MAPSRGGVIPGGGSEQPNASTALLSSSSSPNTEVRPPAYSSNATSSSSSSSSSSSNANAAKPPPESRSQAAAMLPGDQIPEGESFTVRALLVGVLVGTVICFSNMYFGLQTGWISPMTMPASLLGFGIFKLMDGWGWLGGLAFSPVENVLVQTVAGSMAIMPLGCGFVGVIPAMSFLLTPEESGPVVFTLPQSLIWSLGLCYFGVLFAVPLRKQVLIREKLRFPSGFSTAVLIGVLHGRAPHARHHHPSPRSDGDGGEGGRKGGDGHDQDDDDDDAHRFGALVGEPINQSSRPVADGDEEARLLIAGTAGEPEPEPPTASASKSNSASPRSNTEGEGGEEEEEEEGDKDNASSTSSSGSSTTTISAISRTYEQESHPAPSLSSSINLLLSSFLFSGLFNLLAYFFPILHSLPVFGTGLATNWLWDLNPSPAYIGQGIIMGPETTLHMLLGAVVGWGILSPLAKMKGWAPGEVKDWEDGSKGWIVWVSLAIMLADSVVSLGFVAVSPLVGPAQRWADSAFGWARGKWTGKGKGYAIVPTGEEDGVTAGDSGDGRGDDVEEEDTTPTTSHLRSHTAPQSHPQGLRRRPRRRPSSAGSKPTHHHQHNFAEDAPSHQQIPPLVIYIGLALSVLLCIACISIVFTPSLVPLHATVLSVLMALLLSVMGVRALGQTDLNPVSGISKLAQLFFAAVVVPRGDRRAVLVNLVAGAVSEAGALQSGDLMQDLKTGHLLAASPAAQFWGQVLGSTAGAVVSALAYRLYAAAYELPGELFQVPTAYVWVFTARLVTGRGLPPRATEWAVGAAALFALFAGARTAATVAKAAGGKGGRGGGGGKRDTSWTKWVPGGIAVAVGMYNVPSFTLARAAGGVLHWWWIGRKGGKMTGLIILASVSADADADADAGCGFPFPWVWGLFSEKAS
ncbi:oligonucleotide transporter (OPT oligopeptide transporter) [Zalerion maritima]|uniref:Oligonucleotide transporter (OPT oligopeptide transporter) n=1 Tax=Zalerion maritima TaxID=339359 RepID=A0AAD5RZR4_9PEZI|nr:oligonucleotide transporter (OPT oligopeptide transporter) [Zalerion maritima]